MKSWILLCFLTLITACTSNPESTPVTILNYEDFGPQVVAHELIGMEWWQWQKHGDSRPRKYDIKVVVYKNTPLATIKESYPVVPEKEQDYRYVPHDKAIKYLNTLIEEDVIPTLTSRLKSTRKNLLKM